MKESHREGPASHPDPESCVDGRKAGSEALTGAHAGQPSSCEIRSIGVPTLLSEAEGHTGDGVIGEPSPDPAQSETLSMRGNSLHGNREVPVSSIVDGSMDRSGKGNPLTPDMHNTVLRRRRACSVRPSGTRRISGLRSFVTSTTRGSRLTTEKPNVPSVRSRWDGAIGCT